MARQALPKDTELHGRYRVDTVLGAGGFGITYVGQDLHLNRAVAIKEYFPTEFAAREGDYAVRSLDGGNRQFFALGRSWFLREARTLAKYHHPNIVGVMDHFEENNTAYMILRFEDGQKLSSWLRSLGHAPTQAQIDGFLEPILSALETMHRNNDLHRDVAMDNIILRPDGDPVLIDFGSARQAIGAQSRSIEAVVKFGYSPPEQYSVDGKLQGPWSDIYALAATLHLAITGRLPPDAPGRQLDDTYVPLGPHGLEGYRIGMLEGIDWGLRLRPSERPPSISEWRHTLLESAPPPLSAHPVAAITPRTSPSALATTARTSAPRASATAADATVFVGPGRHSALTAAQPLFTGAASHSDTGLRAAWLDPLLLVVAGLCVGGFFARGGTTDADTVVGLFKLQTLLLCGFGAALAVFAGRLLALGEPLRARPRATLALGILWLPTVLLGVVALPLLWLAYAVHGPARSWHGHAITIAAIVHIALGVLLVVLALRESPQFVIVAAATLIGLGCIALLTTRAPVETDA